METKKIAERILNEISSSILGISDEGISHMLNILNMEKRIFCDGAGRSRLQIEGFAMRLTQMGFCSVVVGEATTPAITKDDILLICSGSGETRVLTEHAAKARETGAGVLLITASSGSTLERLSDASILIQASSKLKASRNSVQPMGSLFEQSVGILCDIMVLFLMERYGISNADMYEKHSNLE